MNIHDLLEVLNKCDPEGEVKLSLPVSMIDGGAYEPGVECSINIDVSARWTTEALDAGGLADVVTFELPERERSFLTKHWPLVASVVIGKPLTNEAFERLDTFLADTPEPCDVRQMVLAPDRTVLHLVSREPIRDPSAAAQLRAGFTIIVEGDDGKLPLNPTLPINFGDCSNEARSPEELAVWWDQPFVEGPEGGPYDIRCLDGGAWDRPTWYARVDKLEEAPALAFAKLKSWRQSRSMLYSKMDPNEPALVRMPQHPHGDIEVVRKFASMEEMSAYLAGSPGKSPEDRSG